MTSYWIHLCFVIFVYHIDITFAVFTVTPISTDPLIIGISGAPLPNNGNEIRFREYKRLIRFEIGERNFVLDNVDPTKPISEPGRGPMALDDFQAVLNDALLHEQEEDKYPIYIGSTKIPNTHLDFERASRPLVLPSNEGVTELTKEQLAHQEHMIDTMQRRYTISSRGPPIEAEEEGARQRQRSHAIQHGSGVTKGVLPEMTGGQKKANSPNIVKKRTPVAQSGRVNRHGSIIEIASGAQQSTKKASGERKIAHSEYYNPDPDRDVEYSDAGYVYG
eukprot:488854_1